MPISVIYIFLVRRQESAQERKQEYQGYDRADLRCQRKGVAGSSLPNKRQPKVAEKCGEDEADQCS